MKELETLLENYWISKDKDKELYYKIKDSIPNFKSFITDKLGYQLIVNPYLIKLEKIPGKAESWMGIEAFESPMEYAFLCLVLIYLEDKGKEEQFVLSSITEFIQGNYLGEDKVDWTLYKHRRSLIKVLRFAVEIGMIKIDDGNEQQFANTIETEVLYESTGLSRYLTRNFTMNILNYNTYEDIEKEQWGEIDRDKGIIRRYRVYRRLVMSPIEYNEGIEDVDYDYIKKQRGLISKDLEDYLGFDLHVHRNGALIVLEQDKALKDTFPGGRAISDVVLLLNALITEKIKENKIKIKTDDKTTISKAYFETLIEELKQKQSRGWSKEYREMTVVSLTNEIISYMESFNMIKVLAGQKEIELLPLIGKVIGKYPQDFQETKGKEVEQIDRKQMDNE